MASERWISNITITIHTENDGYTFMRRGPEAGESSMPLEEALRTYTRPQIDRWIREYIDGLEKQRR